MLQLWKVVIFLFIALPQSFAIDNGEMILNQKGQTIWASEDVDSNTLIDFSNQLSLKKSYEKTEKNTACKKTYVSLFDKEKVKWSIFFGYGNNENSDFTSDHYERELFERSLTLPCKNGIQLCEFEIVDVFKGQYKKNLRTHSNRSIEIELTLYNTSISSEVQVNQGLYKKQQLDKSKALENQFISSLNNDDIVYYVGHSRYGTGPGFRPLEKKSKDWWIATLFRPMNNKIYQALNSETDDHFYTYKPKPKFIGLFSCDSEAYYGYEIAKLSPESGLLLTRQSISTEDNLKLLFATSNALLTESCEDEFQTDLNLSIKHVYLQKKQLTNNLSEEKTQHTLSANQLDKSYFPKIFNFFKKEMPKYKNSLWTASQKQNEIDVLIVPNN